MSKQIRFNDSDQELMWKIEAFREAQQISSFIEAVRRLCTYGLSMSDVAKKLK